MNSPYEQALTFIKRHPGCGASIGLSKLILSLYDGDIAFSYRECVRGLDSSNLLIAQDMIHRFSTAGETEDLVVVGRDVIALDRALYDLGCARYAVKLEN